MPNAAAAARSALRNPESLRSVAILVSAGGDGTERSSQSSAT
ncbi:hypothetical protein BN903_43 [Halorubrum sp. AJ67]|nr:hypothetical protein BN903_43 [Halorubrum sp. AJ67]